MLALEIIAERKIREAMERGEFRDLAGKGKPLVVEDLSAVPEELRMAYKVLKNAGCVPPEVELRREIVSLRELVATLEDDAEIRRKRKELDFKLLKLAVLRNRPANLVEYEERVAEKLGTRCG